MINLKHLVKDYLLYFVGHSSARIVTFLVLPLFTKALTLEEYGVFELKSFFTEKMETLEGEEVSTRLIKDKIRQLCEDEDKKKPFSDELLSTKLVEFDYKVARRTVAKYREQLGIPVARLRREII